MAPYRWKPSYVTNKLASNVGHLLDDAEIPNVLWGAFAMRLLLPDLGRNSKDPRIQFIVPDHLLNAATQVLRNAGFPACPGRRCRHRDPDYYVPACDAHVHTFDPYINDAVVLHKKSSVIWALPDFQLCTPPMDDPHYILTSDYRVPQPDPTVGIPYPLEYYPVKILTAPSYVKSLIWLACRDYDHQDQHDLEWMHQVIDFMEFGYLKGYIKHSEIAPRFRRVWEILLSCPRQMKLEVKRLRDDMLAKNELPPPPPRVRR